MFGLGMGEIVIVLVLALILLGPQRLPDAAKKLGQGLREFRKATEDLKSQFETELYQEEKPRRPTLVEPRAPSGAGGASNATAAAAAAAPDVPPATADNVPGLEAALAEPGPVSTSPPAPDGGGRVEGGSEAEAPPGGPTAGARP
jgi:Tat protein translocase TatB subunit